MPGRLLLGLLVATLPLLPAHPVHPPRQARPPPAPPATAAPAPKPPPVTTPATAPPTVADAPSSSSTTTTTAPPSSSPPSSSPPSSSSTNDPATFAAWTRVAVCEEGGWVGYAGATYPDSLGISAANWWAYGGGTDLSPSAQIAVAQRIEAAGGLAGFVPDQAGCASW